MPFHEIQCQNCGNTLDMRFSISESAQDKARAVGCEACGETGHDIVWGAAKAAIVMDFSPGKYSIVPTAPTGGRYYPTKRAMVEDARRNGITVRKN